MKDIKLTNQILLCLLLFSFLVGCMLGERKHAVKRKEGFVPDEKTAIQIAQAVWIPIYGEKQILSEQPFHAVLENEVWTVQGSFFEKYNYKGDGPPPKGGTAIAEIAKKDGRILRISHGE